MSTASFRKPSAASVYVRTWVNWSPVIRRSFPSEGCTAGSTHSGVALRPAAAKASQENSTLPDADIMKGIEPYSRVHPGNSATLVRRSSS